ncbi:MAG: Tol biopolymer transporter periplasmic protein [Cyanobacteria bacterium P01_H01_bin.15]
MHQPKFSIVLMTLTVLLTSCGESTRLVKFPFDRGGRGLNSNFAELMPQGSDRYVVFVSDRNRSQDVYLFDVRSRKIIPTPGLNLPGEIASHPSVSEDGNYIVLTGSLNGQRGIYLYNRRTQQRRRLAMNVNAEVRNPTISADGSRIALEIGREGQWDVAVYSQTGNRIAP